MSYIKIQLEFYPIAKKYCVLLTESKEYLRTEYPTGEITPVKERVYADVFSSEPSAIHFAMLYREQKDKSKIIIKNI